MTKQNLTEKSKSVLYVRGVPKKYREDFRKYARTLGMTTAELFVKLVKQIKE